MATIDELLAGFGEAVLGRPLAVAAGSGICELGFHGTRRLTLEPEPGSDKVHLYSALARLPAREAETVYGKLLTANLYGKGTGEAWFAIDPMREAIVLNRILDTRHLDVDAFGELLTGFMDLVEHWSRALEDAAFADPAEDEGHALAPSPRPSPRTSCSSSAADARRGCRHRYAPPAASRAARPCATCQRRGMQSG